MSEKSTHFGYAQVPEEEKAARVGEVFASVAPRYDLMNDLMSLGLHRVWKRFALEMSGVREGSRVLDVASGSGDLAAAFARRAGPTGQVWMTDINAAMLALGRDKMIDQGLLVQAGQNEQGKPIYDAGWKGKKSVVSRDWSGSSPCSKHSFQYCVRASKSTPHA